MTFTDFQIKVIIEQHEFFSYGRPGESAIFGDIHTSPVSVSSVVVSRVSLKAVRLSGFILLSMSIRKKKFALG
jgi:hypothetical protein